MKRLFWIGDAVAKTGYATVTHQILHYLKDRYDVTVMGLNYNGDPYDYSYPIFPAGAGGDYLGLKRLRELIPRRIRPDVTVICTDPWLICKYLRTFDWPCPVVGYSLLDGPNVNPDELEGLNGLASLGMATEFAAKEIAAAGFEKPTWVAGYAYNADHYVPCDTTTAREMTGVLDAVGEDAFIVSNVNRNMPRKRLDLTIEYFSKWVHEYAIPKNVYLYLHCTDEDHGWDLTQLANYYELGGRVLRFSVRHPDGTHTRIAMGDAVADEQMRFIYSLANLQVSTSLGEGWGLPHMEAMACGVPQLAGKWAALAEWGADAMELVHCDNTYVHCGGINTVGCGPNREAFIKALDHLYRTPFELQQLARKGLARVREGRFSWERSAQTIDEHLQIALNAEAKAA